MNELQTKLVKYGLNEQQAALYELLTLRGEVRIPDIVKALNIPRSSVYEHIRALQALGLAVELQDGAHKKVKAYPIGNLRHGLDEQLADLQQLAAGLEELEKQLRVPAGQPAPAMSVRYYQGIAGARQLMWNSLKTKNTVLVYSQWGRSRFVGKQYYENFVEASKKREIHENVLVNPGKEMLYDIMAGLGQSTSRTNSEDIRAIEASKIVINGETFIYDDTYAQVYLRSGEITGFEIQSAHFAAMQRSIFVELWANAQPVTALI